MLVEGRVSPPGPDPEPKQSLKKLVGAPGGATGLGGGRLGGARGAGGAAGGEGGVHAMFQATVFGPVHAKLEASQEQGDISSLVTRHMYCHRGGSVRVRWVSRWAS